MRHGNNARFIENENKREDNKLHVRTQDVQRILDFNKARNIDGHNRNQKCDLRVNLLSWLSNG